MHYLKMLCLLLLGSAVIATTVSSAPQNETGKCYFNLPRPIVVDSQILIVDTLEYPTIQSAIDAARSGDTVLVPPGTYFENIDYLGKDIIVRSDMDLNPATHDIAPDVTCIDGGGLPTEKRVVTFNSWQSNFATLEGFSIYNGRSSLGGGIICKNASPTIINNHIHENESWDDGGGIFCNGASPRIISNRIYLNTGDGGGGISCHNGSDAVIVNNWIYKNIANNSGGGIYCANSDPIIVNNTICANWGKDNAGGGINVGHSSDVSIGNTIFWENTADIGPEIHIALDSTLTICHSDVQGGLNDAVCDPGCVLNWDLLSMINVDPLFVDEDNYDFHITPDSPCRNTGDNSSVLYPFDIDGEPRIMEGVVDIGADEYSP